MTQESLIRLLAAGARRDTAPTQACPDEASIAGYVDASLDARARHSLERHLADCGHCLRLVGLLSDARREGPVEVAASDVKVPIRPPSRQLRGWWRLTPQWAAAAALVLAIPVLWQLTGNRDVDRGGVEGPSPSAVRAIARTEGVQVVVSGDAEGTLQFNWTPVAGSPFYDVRVVTDDGSVVASGRVVGTAWQLPHGVRLQPGAEYFVHVDAYPSGDKALSSDHVPFRTPN